MDKEILDLANRFFQQQQQKDENPMIHLNIVVSVTEAKELTTLLEKLRHG